MFNICDFDRILKTECNWQHITRNCRLRIWMTLKEMRQTRICWAGLLNMKEKGMIICYNINRCLVIMLLRGGKVNVVYYRKKESKCCGALMKNCRKVKGEQVITLQMAQQLKTKNINVVPGQLFCCQCKAKFLLETDSLYW